MIKEIVRRDETSGRKEKKEKASEKEGMKRRQEKL